MPPPPPVRLLPIVRAGMLADALKENVFLQRTSEWFEFNKVIIIFFSNSQIFLCFPYFLIVLIIISIEMIFITFSK